MSDLPEELERLLHDLRGPLNSAVMHLEVLKRTALADPAAAHSLATVAQQLDRLAALLPAVMHVVALERADVRRVNLRDVAERALAAAGCPDITLAPPPWPDVVGDAGLLELAAAHLMRNAVEATPPGAARPHVHAEQSAEGPDAGRVALVVRDWGTGLRSTNVKVLVRLLASTKGPGRGLGLITAERIARLHGGGLRFHAPGDGAEVRLVLAAG